MTGHVSERVKQLRFLCLVVDGDAAHNFQKTRRLMILWFENRSSRKLWKPVDKFFSRHTPALLSSGFEEGSSRENEKNLVAAGACSHAPVARHERTAQRTDAADRSAAQRRRQLQYGGSLASGVSDAGYRVF